MSVGLLITQLNIYIKAMHFHFEQNTNTKCDCNVHCMSWMGKVPDELPEVSQHDSNWLQNA